MKNIEKSSVKYLILLIFTISVCGIILYPLFDIVWCKLITKSEFTYSIFQHVISPILFGIIFGIITWIADKNKKQ